MKVAKIATERTLDSFYQRRNEGALPVLGADGRRLSLTLYVQYAVLRGRDGAEARLPRSYTLELDDGSLVERIGDESSDEFVVKETGEMLRLDR